MTEPAPNRKPPASGLRRILYLLLALVFTVVGVAGAVLPVLPTTPFLLLASFFLTRSSPRLNEAMLRSRFLGPILLDWQEQKGIRSHVRWQAIVTVVVTLGCTIAFASSSTTMSCVIAGLGIIGITVILRLPRLNESDDG